MTTCIVAFAAHHAKAGWTRESLAAAQAEAGRVIAAHS